MLTAIFILMIEPFLLVLGNCLMLIFVYFLTHRRPMVKPSNVLDIGLSKMQIVPSSILFLFFTNSFLFGFFIFCGITSRGSGTNVLPPLFLFVNYFFSKLC